MSLGIVRLIVGFRLSGRLVEVVMVMFGSNLLGMILLSIDEMVFLRVVNFWMMIGIGFVVIVVSFVIVIVGNLVMGIVLL